MDIDWCLGCETQLTRPSVHGGYCTSSCYFKTTNDTTAYRQHSVFDSSSSDSEDDDDEEEQRSRQPSTSIRPSRVERIKKWAASVPACAGHPHLLPPPPPPTSLAASLQGFSRPALLRRHSALRPTPASTFVSKTRPIPTSTSPSSSPLTARARPSPPQSSIVGSPSIASSFLAPPSKVLHRIRSWVKSEPSTPTTTVPAFEDEEAELPRIVTLDDTASTSTLVGDTPIPEKVQEWTTVSPAASLPADELSRLVLGARHRHRASRVKLSDMASETHSAHIYL